MSTKRLRTGCAARSRALAVLCRGCSFIVTPNQVKPFFSASLQQPRHNTASARDLEMCIRDRGEGEEQTLMALVTTEKMLKDAQAGHYAVGAFLS